MVVIAALLVGQESAWGSAPPVAPYQSYPLPSERVVRQMIFPVVGQTRWRDDFNSNRGSHYHTGIDIKAPKMTPIVAPFSGTLGMKTESFWIWADDGWAMLGTHLNDDTPGTNDNSGDFDFMFAPNMAPGRRLEAGQLIGYVGDSGDATAPHLHFELFAPPGNGERRYPAAGRLRNPFASLKAAQVISSPRVSISNYPPKPEKGEIRFDGCLRSVNPSTRQLYAILVCKVTTEGTATAYTKPTFRKFKLSTDQAKDVEFLSKLKLGRNEVISFYVDSAELATTGSGITNCKRVDYTIGP